ncbi:hypothetical protein [Psychroflexus lacisalsi]|nr:hypothetical protein [Psychroflexus lacisalsi]MBZ9620833.1 hypothetical protein [Psychroflexus lacisalsi]
MKSQRIKSYTFTSRSKSQPPEPKLVNKHVFANAVEKKAQAYNKELS